MKSLSGLHWGKSSYDLYITQHNWNQLQDKLHVELSFSTQVVNKKTNMVKKSKKYNSSLLCSVMKIMLFINENNSL